MFLKRHNFTGTAQIRGCQWAGGGRAGKGQLADLLEVVELSCILTVVLATQLCAHRTCRAAPQKVHFTARGFKNRHGPCWHGEYSQREAENTQIEKQYLLVRWGLGSSRQWKGDRSGWMGVITL